METVYTEKRKKIIRNSIFVFLFVALLLTFTSRTINEFLLPEVIVTEIKSGYLENIVSAVGEIQLADLEKVNSFGEWKIVDIAVEAGAKVKKGEVLAVVDKENMRYTIKSKELDLLRLENELLNYANKSMSIDISGYEGDVKQSANGVKKLEENLEDVRLLYESGAETKKSLKDAEEALEKAKSDYDARLKLLEQKREEINNIAVVNERTIKEKKLELELKEMEIDAARKYISADGEILSPIDGSVRTVYIEEGSTCLSGQLLFEIAPVNSHLSVKWFINPSKSENLKENDPVSIHVKTNEGIDTIEGIIHSKRYIADQGVYEFTSLIDSNREMQDGHEANVRCVKRSAEYLLIVPNGAITQVDGRDAVFIVKEREGILGNENFVEKMEVKVEESDDFNTAITGALSPGEEVVEYSSKALYHSTQVKMR